MAGPWHVTNFRFDKGGHAIAIQLRRWISSQPDVDEWQWYDLDGNPIEGESGSEPVFPHVCLGLRLDARGHAVATLAWLVSSSESGPLTVQWYDLGGDPVGDPILWVEAGPGAGDLEHVRLDARGHFVAVAMTYEHIWYDLAGQLAA